MLSTDGGEPEPGERGTIRAFRALLALPWLPRPWIEHLADGAGGLVRDLHDRHNIEPSAILSILARTQPVIGPAMKMRRQITGRTQAQKDAHVLRQAASALIRWKPLLEGRFPWRSIVNTADQFQQVRGALRRVLERAPREDELLRAWTPKVLRPRGARSKAVANLRALGQARPEASTRHLYPPAQDLAAVAALLDGLRIASRRPPELELGRCALQLEALFRARAGRPLLGAIGTLLLTAFPKHMTSAAPRTVDQLLRRARGHLKTVLRECATAAPQSTPSPPTASLRGRKKPSRKSTNP